MLIYDSKQKRDLAVSEKLILMGVRMRVELPFRAAKAHIAGFYLKLIGIPTTVPGEEVKGWLKSNNIEPKSNIKFLRYGQGDRNFGSGARGVYCEVHREMEVPGFAEFRTKSCPFPVVVELYYQGMVKYCRRCFQPGHMQFECKFRPIYGTMGVSQGLRRYANLRWASPVGSTTDFRPNSEDYPALGETNQGGNGGTLTSSDMGTGETEGETRGEPSGGDKGPSGDATPGEDQRGEQTEGGVTTADTQYSVVVEKDSSTGELEEFQSNKKTVLDKFTPGKCKLTRNWTKYVKNCRKYKRGQTFFSKGTSLPMLSNHHRAEIVVEGVSYKTVEHFLFATKARIVGNLKDYKRIMNCGDPRDVKLIGEGLQWPSDLPKWRDIAMEILWKGNIKKYTQNEDLRLVLESTDGSILGEASVDPFWGIGLRGDDSGVQELENWGGRNMMGILLTTLRDQLLRPDSGGMGSPVVSISSGEDDDQQDMAPVGEGRPMRQRKRSNETSPGTDKKKERTDSDSDVD